MKFLIMLMVCIGLNSLKTYVKFCPKREINVIGMERACLSDLGGAPLPVARRPIMKATAPRVRLPKWPFHLQRGGSRNRISRRAFQDEAKRNSLGVLKASSKFGKMSVLGSMMNPLAKERMKEAEDRHR